VGLIIGIKLKSEEFPAFIQRISSTVILRSFKRMAILKEPKNGWQVNGEKGIVLYLLH